MVRVTSKLSQSNISKIHFLFSFFLFCCPLCYGCYLSRTLRLRAKSKAQKTVPKFSMVESREEETGELFACSNGTLLRQVSQTQKAVQQQQQVEAKKKSSIINVNVIIMQSGSSSLINNCLGSETSVTTVIKHQNEDESDGVKNRRKSTQKYLSIPKPFRRPSLKVGNSNFEMISNEDFYLLDPKTFISEIVRNAIQSFQLSLGGAKFWKHFGRCSRRREQTSSIGRSPLSTPSTDCPPIWEATTSRWTVWEDKSMSISWILLLLFFRDLRRKSSIFGGRGRLRRRLSSMMGFQNRKRKSHDFFALRHGSNMDSRRYYSIEVRDTGRRIGAKKTEEKAMVDVKPVANRYIF